MVARGLPDGSVLLSGEDVAFTRRAVRHYVLAIQAHVGIEAPPQVRALLEVLAASGNNVVTPTADVPPSPRGLTVGEAADQLGITPRAVRYRCARGTVTAHKHADRWVVGNAGEDSS